MTMGWCSGTDIFDAVAADVIDSELPEAAQERIIKTLINAMEDHDWDCQGDSDYYEHPLVQRVVKELHPDWFEDEDD
jgi:hypothetical protein